MEPRDLIVLTPPGHADPSVAIAACRAGAWGVLDLEYPVEPDSLASAVDKLARFAPSGWGVQLPTGDGGLLARLLAESGRRRPALLVWAGPDEPDLADRIRLARSAGLEVWREAVTVAEAVGAVAAGADGVILKGHEAGGRVGADTSFVLVQKWRHHAERHGLKVPFRVRGGIGPGTAAACRVAGAAGVVLDAQVLLAREGPADEALRRRLAGADGSETALVRLPSGAGFRFYARPDSPAAQQLLAAGPGPVDVVGMVRVGIDPAVGVWPLGQDAALAAPLARTGGTVAGIIRQVCEGAARHEETARRLRPLAEGAPLARSHGTRYPILQGPMTRVSDTAAFAAAVADGGALPFLALALLRKAEVERLLRETQARLGSRPWGVGILGFVPPEVRAEQLEAVRACRPPFAVIAGGRPDQARELEALGIATYLHVPSPGLLRLFLKEGARRFIFEGQECGGHVGPRSSFVLWELMTGVLAEHLAARPQDELHVVFAGGIHDRLSARMVETLAAGLAEKGAKVGVLLGTAYLFTQEAVETGAITARFQKEALACRDTVLLETGPGHAIRCIPTPYAETFEAEKARLRAEGKSPQEIGLALERMNLGRLRVASKGVDRSAAAGGALVPVPEEEQYRRGMYMIGQVAALRSEVTTIARLHADICGDPVPSAAEPARASVAVAPALPAREPPAPPPCDVAIIGLSCFYPGATSLWGYWENILAKVNAVIEIPPTHWDWRPFYDPDPRARDKIISKWGGFLSDVYFDPLKYGITPKSLPHIEPLQLLLLEAVHQALADAGYLDRPFPRERTCAILGIGGGGMPLSVAYGFRACMPLLESIPGIPVKGSDIIELAGDMLPEWTEDSFPGILLNVAAGRVANRFDLGGPNMAIDAACGSSLAAVYAAVRELTAGTSDLAVVMGGDAVQTPYAYVAFSKTHALSPRGRCRPFDAEADGIALAEGVGVAILKRLADAERDGDRIYAVIKGVGSSSDGRDKGLTAPRAEGQLRALHRAYAQARISPARVGLVEAHGTGTVVGDQTEARAIGQLFRDAGAAPRSCAIGSVKSMIGHTKCAAGLAGLIKTAFALRYKVLPPTLVEKPNPKANFEDGPLYLNTEARPWVHGADHPRTAGVSAFGFGGTNFHVVLEEYTGDYLDRPEGGLRHWPAELFVWRRADRAALAADIRACRDALLAGAAPEPADLAAAVWASSRDRADGPTLAVVASSLPDLTAKLADALNLLDQGTDRHADPRGLYFAARPAAAFGAAGRPPVAFLFPGQGSQYPDMLAQQAIAFPEVREAFDRAERLLAADLDRPLGRLVYPPSPFTPEQETANRQALQRPEVAQPAIGAAALGLYRLLTALGVEADYFAGHSYGEYVALAAAGAMSEDDLIRLSFRRGVVLRDAAATGSGGMLAAEADASAVASVLGDLAGVWVANHNSPRQTVLAGTDTALEATAARLRAAGVRTQRLPVACGFHSPLVAPAREPFAAALAAVRFAGPRRPVFSNVTAAPHPADPAALAATLVEHLVSPVRFADEVLALYDAGARVFVEVGPGSVLTGLVSQTLAGRPHLAVAADHKGRLGLVQVCHLLGQLVTAGVPVRLDRLFQGRDVRPLELSRLGPETGKPKLSPTTWVVNSVRSRPLNGPEPRLLGQPLPPEARTAAGRSLAPRMPAQIRADQTLATPPAAPIQPVATPAASSASATRQTPPVDTRLNGTYPIPRVTMTPSEPTPVPVARPANGCNGSTPSSPLPDGAAAVMMRFQEVMARFLDTQRSVMLAYLGGTPAAAPATHPLNGNGSVASPALSPVPAARLTSEPGSLPTRLGPEPGSSPRAESGSLPTRLGPEPGSSLRAEPGSSPTRLASLDRDALLDRLLDLVSERTGYPKDALSIDQDLEADLGIDSIKRVEILGALAESLGTGPDGRQPNLEMEKLSVIKTLRGIADYVLEAVSAPSPPVDGSAPAAVAPPPADRPTDRHPGAREGDVQRLVIRRIDAPLPSRPRLTPPAGTVLITDDRHGTARELADRLAELDVPTVLVRMADGSPVPEGVLAADLTDPAAVADLLARLRSAHGPLAGLVHLLPLAAPLAGDTPEARIRRDVWSLYLLTRGLEPDLREAARAGGAYLLAVTALGGTFGYGPTRPGDLPVGHGGVAGFTKCLAYEWPGVTVRVLDVDPETPATRLAEWLLAEMGEPEGPVEVGRAGERRVTWQVEPGPLDHDSPRIELGPQDTVLVTGGARGITARVARELARRFRPRLVLVGSSPLPAEEPADTAGLTHPAEIKAALLRRQPDARPATIEAQYRRLLKDREIRANLEAIRATGATVEYRAVDVRDPAAFGALLDELNAAPGGLTGVIHGAGVIEDKLLRDKTPESFDRVFGTKVDSTLTLTRKLDPSRLKFLVLFASIASRYGNRGQADYAAANEVLAKTACDLDRKWPGRVVAIAWGPWAEVGMVADLEKHLVARGLKLIDPAVGAALAVDEIIYGAKGEPEVVVAGGTEAASRVTGTPAAAAAGPVAEPALAGRD